MASLAEQSAASSSSIPAKRKRKTFSCLECRRRKLRCDRSQPSCGRCQTQESACTYAFPLDPELHQSESDDHPGRGRGLLTPTPSHSIITPSFGRVCNIGPMRYPLLQAPQSQGTWGLLGDQAATNTITNERPAIKADTSQLLEPEQPEKKENVIFRGTNFKTQYYGGSNPTSLIGDFPELRSFMRFSIKSHPSLPRVQRELKSLQMKWKVEKSSLFSSFNVDLLYLLPEEEIADQLLHIYLDTVETTYRIIHIPSFLAEYQSFQENKSSGRPAFIVLMLLMMSTASCLSNEGIAYVGDSAVARERAALWIEISERWLQKQSHKQIYLSIWQIRCLLLLSKQINVIKKKRIWTEAGTLLRQAMAAGFHRDPRSLGENVSGFDQEMRRRLWSTITELELQASIDRGMPSASAGIVSDCASILNIDDACLTDEGNNQPGAKSWNDFTKSSFLHVSRSSFALRVELNSVVNDLSSSMEWEQIANYEELVRAELDKLPLWTKTPDTNEGVLSGSFLQVQLCQFLILLHAPFARKRSSNSRLSASRMECLQAATRILEQVRQLNEQDYYFFLLIRQEYFRAALVVCHNAFICYDLKGDLFAANISSSIRHLDDSLALLEDRITRIGTDFTRYWYISAARALLRSVVDPSDSTRQEEQAIEHVARQYYRIRASQEDMQSTKEKLKLAGNPTPSSDDMLTIPDIPFHIEAMPSIDFSLEALEGEFFFGDPAAWIFDNFDI